MRLQIIVFWPQLDSVCQQTLVLHTFKPNVVFPSTSIENLQRDFSGGLRVTSHFNNGSDTFKDLSSNDRSKWNAGEQ